MFAIKRYLPPLKLTARTTTRPKFAELQLVKGDERYVFRFDAETWRDVLDRAEVFASDERLSFSWDDFYELREHMRGLAK